MRAKKPGEVLIQTVDIPKLERGTLTFNILGTTPIILNRMSQKGARELLLPPRKQRRKEGLKHNPMEEFKASPYIDENPKGPTYVQHLASAFKGALCGAALDLPGASKAQIGRLVRVEGERVSLYGVPKLKMDITRNADINKTPDVRTRCCLPEWCCTISISFSMPLFNKQSIFNLLITSGEFQGIGDYRCGKGKGTFGSFTPVNEGDPTWKRIKEAGGRKIQVEAMSNPQFYDSETEEMYAWFLDEIRRRGDEALLTGAPAAVEEVTAVRAAAKAGK
jgi:hypothetical protein